MPLIQALKNGATFTRLQALEHHIANEPKANATTVDWAKYHAAIRIDALFVGFCAAVDAVVHGPGVFVKKVALALKTSGIDTLRYAVVTPFMLIAAIFSPKHVVKIGQKFKIIEATEEQKSSWLKWLPSISSLKRTVVKPAAAND